MALRQEREENLDEPKTDKSDPKRDCSRTEIVFSPVRVLVTLKDPPKFVFQNTLAKLPIRILLLTDAHP